jgi:hypothetical protein
MNLFDNANISAKTSLLFSVARWISIIFGLLAFAGSMIVLAMALVTFGPAGINVPQYGVEGEHETEFSIFAKKPLSGYAQQTERANLTGKYSEKIIAILERHQIKRFKLEDIIASMQQDIPDDYYSDFLNGWDAYVKAGLADHGAKDGAASSISSDELSKRFFSRFSRAIQQGEAKVLEAQGKRMTLLPIGLGLVMCFVTAMIVPLLVVIEKNTRHLLQGVEEIGATSETAANFSTLAPVGTPCPQCGSAIAPGDAFCGECGHKLRMET